MHGASAGGGASRSGGGAGADPWQGGRAPGVLAAAEVSAAGPWQGGLAAEAAAREAFAAQRGHEQA
jgi:hypothetical protein